MPSSQEAPPCTGQDLRIFNPPVETRTFSLFSKLPYDIRYMIWKKAMAFERFIKIQLLYRGCVDDREISVNHPDGYVINVPWPEEMIHDPMLNPFLVTCSDSRTVAIVFYRVRLPCYFEGPDGMRRPGTLHVCPETDTIHVNSSRASYFVSMDYIVALCKLVYVNDFNKVGLSNLALSISSQFLPFGQAEMFKAVVHRLSHIIFVQQNKVRRNRPSRSLQANFLPQLCHSIPICGSTIAFGRLPADPRAIQDDLRSVHMGSDLHRIGYISWCACLRAKGIEANDLDVEWRFLLSSMTEETLQITDRESALRWLGSESCNDNRTKTLPTVVGFWMFPLHAVLSKTHRRQESMNMVDSPPELYVAHLR
ncbi:hypothetical protein FSPOR_9231 [Fusarium sporotrichioides]|uniref:2EXR domain-containing protein n=1 Tax=Fusarium sporotrichioides TaxID=5514 RepID=A0A395RRC1_FUSSP|nr:hypothetical protein FSPOR_9231 [Fusarium sporotrichioides]